jgi:Protein kinase domain
MASKRRWLGVVALVGGGVLGAAAYRGARAEGARRTTEARETASRGEETRLAEARRAAESHVREAAGLQPLNAAVGDHVDGTTLVDLVENEDWARPLRDGVAVFRIVVGDELLAARGPTDLGATDRPVVREARKHRVASAIVQVANQSFVFAGARLDAMPEREPVLLLAIPLATVAPTVIADEPWTREIPRRPALWAGAGALLLLGLGMIVLRTSGQVAVEIPREPTLRFGTPARPRERVSMGEGAGASARQPLANGNAMSIPGTGPGAPIPPGVSQTPPRGPGATPAAPMPMATQERQMFGRYRVIDRLGEGGMSEIYTAEATGVENFSRTFVLKRLRPELAREKEAIAQFIDEARMQASLVHSNIVPVFDFGMVENEYFMTQEYIRGRDLGKLTTRVHEATHRALEPRVAYYVAYETLQALAYAHGKKDKNGQPMGIVHRDVSVGNVLLSLEGEVKLFDFGIVKSNRRVSRTQMGMVKGNANFMSPEQARGQSVDARSDLFSMGMVLYYCLMNAPLYGGENDLDVLYKAAQGPTEDDYRRIRDLPEPAATILSRALAFEPSDRFQTAGEFADLLGAHTGGGKMAATQLMHRLFGEELGHEASRAS